MSKTKMVLVVVLVLVAAAASGQENNGFDWVAWSETQKVFYVAGVFDALETCWNMFLEMAETPEAVDEVGAMFFIPGTVGDLVEEIDRVYRNYEYREVDLMIVVLVATGKYDRWFGGTDD